MITAFDWEVSIIMALIAIICFYQAFINIIKKKYTHFGLDALMVFINMKLAGKRENYVRKHIADAERVRRMGISTLLFGLGFLGGLIKFLVNQIYLH